ncbi:NAD-dependent succinate-semialdehyde dehydrogenase [Thermotoga sp. Ku-13t]|uniref:aldehyde dehydrogenase family protein n=1 Tax=Thermotoga sp. Ku-13t TaxID=1755813 RepID=UPI0013E9A922|nr:NAD-dependent succinate-semialdehyde dehydrogenase [Thermotoga sp. Ku-13t]KAF2958454.1 NAD-dependent succinate-semialdehyde dehydrogenase [Thermotoga sp. Ku-13t]
MISKCIIAGEMVESLTKRTILVRNPANTDQVVGEVPSLTSEETEKAIVSAYEAFKTWSTVAPIKRVELLRQGTKLARQRQEEIAKLLTLEQGKPLSEAKEEVKASLDSIDYFCDNVLSVLGETYQSNKENRISFVLKQPVGVVAAIVPWNYPLLLLSWKIGPALAVGCTVVAKPSSYTPLATLELAKCFLEAGLPAGVLNVVTGTNNEVGETLIEHPLVSKIAFTGSTDVGKHIMNVASKTVKKLTLELGGNCPMIVFDDADIAAAAKDAARRSFRNAGQICNAINRIYVHKSIFSDFVEAFLQETKKIKIGNGLEEGVTMGPLTTLEGWKRVSSAVEEAVSKGAQVLYGGKKPAGEKFEKGYFYEPTILIKIDHSMRVAREEMFGPTAPIMTFDTFDEAISLANDTEYGLVAYVYTRDLSKALRASTLLECGTVGINNVTGGEFAYPYGGWKQSGLGVENSHHAYEQYLLLKHVRIDY